MVISLIVVIALVFMITGVILKNALMLLLAFIPWIIFAFLANSYEFDNAAINTGLLMFGWIIAIICAFWALGIWTSGGKGTPAEDDEESYRKKVMNATRRR